MPPKAAAKKAAAPASHASYRDMIKDAIVNLKERNGSSRQSIKKYVLSNNNVKITSQAAFDAQFNKAIKAGVDKDEFTQPKGPSGPLKLAKKEPAAAKKEPAKPAPKTAAKPAAKTAAKPAAKRTSAKTASKAAPKKATKTTAKKPAAKATTKKTTTAKTSTAKGSTTKKAAGRPKANTAKPRKASTSAPAVVEQPKVISKTKSGRVTKTTAAPAPPAKKRAAKKA